MSRLEQWISSVSSEPSLSGTEAPKLAGRDIQIGAALVYGVKGFVRPFKQAGRWADTDHIHPPKHHGRLAISPLPRAGRFCRH